MVRVGYNRTMAGLFTGLGVLLLVLNLALLPHLRTPVLRFIPPVICVLLGIAYFVRPYFEAGVGLIVIHAPLGPVKKRYEWHGPDQFIVEEGKRFFIEVDGRRKRVRLSRWLADKGDWQRFLDVVQTADLADTFE